MGIDAITLSINNLRDNMFSINSSYKNHCQFPNFLTGDGKLLINLDKLKVHKNNNRYKTQLVTMVDGIFFSYMPYIHRGYISIQFNVPKLLYDNNILTVFSYNKRDIWMKLCDKLDEIIDLRSLPYIDFWRVSEYENSIDIIDTIDNNKMRYDVISKSAIKNMYRDDKYINDGTVYFRSSQSASPAYKIKAYDKLKEVTSKFPHYDLSDLYDSDLIRIKEGYNILRIEKTNYRESIANSFIYSTSKNSQYNNYDLKPVASNLSSYNGTFAQVFDFNYQSKELAHCISILNLDKVVTTKHRLIKIIESSINLKSWERKSYVKAIKYINNDLKNQPVNDNLIYGAINYVLNQGYHYIYSLTVLEPVTLTNIINTLPIAHKENIALYGSNNLFQSFFF